MHLEDVAAAAKLRGDIGGKHLRVAARHVDVDVRTPDQTVEDVVPDVTYCLRKHPDGSYLLLAVNNQREPLKVKFLIDLPRLPRTMVDNINKSDVVWLKGNNKVTISFKPFGVHAYIFRP